VNAFTKVVKAIATGIEWPFVHGGQVIRTIETALKDEPVVKTAVVGLLAEIATISEDGAVAVAARGMDFADDMQTIADAQKLWKYVTTVFIPAVDAAYVDLKTAVEPGPVAVLDPPPVSMPLGLSVPA
jgi:hypothetical protein